MREVMIEGRQISAYMLTSFDLATGRPIGACTIVCDGRVVKQAVVRELEISDTDCHLRLINEILRWVVENTLDCDLDIFLRGRFTTQVFTEMLRDGKYSEKLFEDERELLEETRGLMTDRVHFVPIPMKDNDSGFVEYTRQVLQAVMEAEGMSQAEDASSEEVPGKGSE